MLLLWSLKLTRVVRILPVKINLTVNLWGVELSRGRFLDVVAR